jgi:hypothetical protein
MMQRRTGIDGGGDAKLRIWLEFFAEIFGGGCVAPKADVKGIWFGRKWKKATSFSKLTVSRQAARSEKIFA